jgi:hypothetical protein
LNTHDQNLIFDHIVEVRKQSALEEAEPKERIMMVSSVVQEAGFEAGGKVFEAI